ncbi:MAG: hypothetical protein WAT46_17975 [Saprospiraceae bacterium]
MVKVNLEEKFNLFTEHKPVADAEVLFMLFEPATTINTGNVKGELTKEKLEKI